MLWQWTFEEKIVSNIEQGVKTVRLLVSHLEENEWPAKDVFGIHMALEEALMNAIKHGNQQDESKLVHVTAKTSSDSFYIKIADQGEGFDPDSLPDPTLEENLEKTTGRGILLIRSYMDSVVFNSSGNSIEIKKAKSSNNHKSESDEES